MAINCELTEIMVLSNSIPAELCQYAFTRLIRWRVAALWLLLMAAYLAADASAQSLFVLMMTAAFLMLAIVTFRVWDDLSDRDHDRLYHPQRVMVANEHLWPFVVVVIAGVLLLALMLWEDRRQLSIFLSFIALMALLYNSGLGKRAGRPLRAGLVLAKYPLFLFLILVPSLRVWLVGVGVLLFLSIYEWRDDSRLRETSVAQFIAGVGTGAVFVSVLYVSTGAFR